MAKAQLLSDISDQIDRMGDYSMLQIICKKHRGQLAKAEFTMSTTQLFSDVDPNVTAANQIYQMMKLATMAAATSKQKTTLGFNLVINELGNAEMIQVQDHSKK